MTIRLKNKRTSEDVRIELKQINLENERLKLLKNSLIAEKVAKSELSVTEFNPIVSIQSLQEYQEILSRKNQGNIEEVNILLKGVKWDSLAYNIRSQWLVALVSNFKSTIEARHFPQFEDLIVENILKSLKSSTVYLEPQITQNDLIIGEMYKEKLEEINLKIDSKNVKVGNNLKSVLSESDTMDFEKELDDFYEFYFSDKLTLSLEEIFGPKENLLTKLNSAVKLSHLTFIDKIAYNKDKKSFESLVDGKL